MMQGKKVSIEALEGDFPCHADGEWICLEGKSVEVEILPSAFTIIG